jgi:hypothetical protein
MLRKTPARCRTAALDLGCVKDCTDVRALGIKSGIRLRGQPVTDAMGLEVSPEIATTRRMIFSRISQKRSRMRIVATKFAIGKMVYSIGSPHQRVFTQPRPRADIGRLEIPQRSEPLT